jgi:trypsin
MRRIVARLAVAAAMLCAALAAGPASAAEVEPRVVGGQTTTIAEWPWQVALADHQDLEPGTQNGFERQFCGGSLVAPTIVVTAAHCVYGFSQPNDFDDPGSVSVIAGRTTLSTSVGQELDVDEIWYFVDDGAGGAELEGQAQSPNGNELFDDSTLDWDTAFLQLASSAASPAVPIKIAGPDEAPTWAPGQPAFITGWGATSSGGSGVDTLREAQIEMISDTACASGSVYGSEFFPETMVCAGFLSGGVDTCQGDSGGPLVVPLLGGGFRLVGSTSWGIGCALPNKPGVYGRIADDPMRSALAAGIQTVAGVNVLGSGGQPVSPPTPPPPPPPPTTDTSSATTTSTAVDDADCAEARERLRVAKRKLRRAKRRLENADTKLEEHRAERRVKRAKRRVRRAKRAVAAECAVRP